MADKRVRNDRFNIEWTYAKECWSSHPNYPPIPDYTIWESVDGGKEKVIGFKRIKPKKVTKNGLTLF